MLEIVINSEELYDEDQERFIKADGQTLRLEHSLVSLSKWESKWEIPFLSEDKKTTEQTLDYIYMMCLDEGVNPDSFKHLDAENTSKIEQYIQSKQTATWFAETNKKSQKKQVITAELVYYWMIAHQIPFECQYWHFNKLLTLIQVCNAKNAPEKKADKKTVMERNRALNAQRKAQMNSAG